MCGESIEFLAEVVEQFITKFPDFARGFKDNGIFNADECELFKVMPYKSLIMKDDKRKSRKLSKEPDPETIFQAILSKVQPNGEVNDAPGKWKKKKVRTTWTQRFQRKGMLGI